MSITFNPKNIKVRKRKHGFRLRMKTTSGKNIIANRRKKGRINLTVA